MIIASQFKYAKGGGRVGLFNRVKKRAFDTTGNSDNEAKDVLLKALLGNLEVDKEKCMQIPSVAKCVELIENTVSMLQVGLYQEKNGETTEIKDDNRLYLLNKDTGDTYNPMCLKKALTEDYLFYGIGRAYINKSLNNIESINYVEKTHLSVIYNTDPIFKAFKVTVDGIEYYPFEFINVYRKMKSNGQGKGIIEENSEILSLLYAYLRFEKNLVATGGNKKGFLKSAKKLSQEAMDKLKEAWKNLYSNSENNVVILNDGLDFKESSNTSVEMQLKENKNINDAGICSIFQVPYNLLSGSFNNDDYTNFIKIAIIPILTAIETALNQNLLSEEEKRGSFYFAFKTEDVLKGDLKTRYEAYEIALNSNFMQIDEVRNKENLKPLGLQWIKIGLQDVLYDPKNKTIYTPNTNKLAKIEEQQEVGDDKKVIKIQNKKEVKGGDEQ